MPMFEIKPAEPSQRDYQKPIEPGGSKIDIIIGFILNTIGRILP